MYCAECLLLFFQDGIDQFEIESHGWIGAGKFDAVVPATAHASAGKRHWETAVVPAAVNNRRQTKPVQRGAA